MACPLCGDAKSSCGAAPLAKPVVGEWHVARKAPPPKPEPKPETPDVQVDK